MQPNRLPRSGPRLAIAALVTALMGLFLLSGTAAAQPLAIHGAVPVPAATARIKLALRASGLYHPTFVTSARDGSGRLFILEQTGRIKIYKNGAILATPFLSLAGSVGTAFEQGLLGLAFHPSFTTNHKLYVAFNDLNNNTIIREYRTSSTNPNVVNKATGRTIMTIAKPYNDHNGGMLAFGTDGYLYISTGDGGGIGDFGNRAQNIYTLLGKILRIDINGTTATKQYRVPATNPYASINGYDEIWQLGLRNPWRWSFDRANGNMWIGDVGQATWEEIDRAVKTSSGAGKGINWGWRVLEGTHCYKPATGCNTTGMTMPVTEYQHLNGRCAVIGGYVYRGTAIPALVGQYVFGDFCTGEIMSIPANAAAGVTPTVLLDSALTISSFGENQSGELYVVDRGGGKLYAIVAG